MDSESKVEVSSWGVIAVVISWLECEEEGSTGVGTGSGKPSVLWMWVARHLAFWASVARRTPLLVNEKVKGGCGWTIFLKKDQTWETEVENDRKAQKEAHAECFSSRITCLHWASR